MNTSLIGTPNAAAPMLPGGEIFIARVRTTRSLAPDADAGVAYEVGRSTTAGQPGQTLHTLLVGGRTHRGPFTLGARAGAAALATSGTATTIVRPAAELSATLPLGQPSYALGDGESKSPGIGGAVLAFGAAHTPAPALGIGRVLVTDRIGGELTHGIAKRLALHAGAEAAWSDDPLAPTLRWRATTLAAELHYALPSLLGIGDTRGSSIGGTWIALGLFARNRRQLATPPAANPASAFTAVATRGITLTFGHGLP